MFWYVYTLWNNLHTQADYHIYHITWLSFFDHVVRILKIYSFNKFQASNTVSLTIVTLSIISGNYSSCVSEMLYPLTSISLCPPLPASEDHHFTLCLYELAILNFTLWDHAVYSIYSICEALNMDTSQLI